MTIDSYIEISVDKTQVDYVTRKVIRVANPTTYTDEMEQLVEWAKSEIKNYPPKAAGAFSRLATAGQKRAFWAKVRSGQAQVDEQGYVRTGRLRNSWQSQVNVMGTSLVGMVSSAENYAKFVHGAKEQVNFHRASKWMTDMRLAERSQVQIRRIFIPAFKREASK